MSEAKPEVLALGIDVTTEERERRQRNVLRNILAISAMAGAMPVGLGVPGYQDLIGHEQARALKTRSDSIATVRPYVGPFVVVTPPRARSLAEKKARRAKRKQRRNR